MWVAKRQFPKGNPRACSLKSSRRTRGSGRKYTATVDAAIDGFAAVVAAFRYIAADLADAVAAAVRFRVHLVAKGGVLGL